MGWLHRLKDSVSSQIRNSAAGFSGKVQVTCGKNIEFRAFVSDTMRYGVAVYLVGEAVVVHCNCPASKRPVVCSHVWAGLVAAESLGHLSQIALLRDPHIRVEGAGGGSAGRPANVPRPAPPSPWKAELAALRQRVEPEAVGRTEPPRRIFYTVATEECINSNALIIQVEMCRWKKDGGWGKPNWHESEIRCVSQLEEADRQLLGILGGDYKTPAYGMFLPDKDSVNSKRRISRGAFELLIPMLCATGRFLLEPSDLPENFRPLQCDTEEPWKLEIAITKNEKARTYVISGWLKREGKQLKVSAPRLMSPAWSFSKIRSRVSMKATVFNGHRCFEERGI